MTLVQCVCLVFSVCVRQHSPLFQFYSFFFYFSRPRFKIFISGFAAVAVADLSNSGNDCVNWKIERKKLRSFVWIISFERAQLAELRWDNSSWLALFAFIPLFTFLFSEHCCSSSVSRQKSGYFSLGTLFLLNWAKQFGNCNEPREVEAAAAAAPEVPRAPLSVVFVL